MLRFFGRLAVLGGRLAAGWRLVVLAAVLACVAWVVWRRARAGALVVAGRWVEVQPPPGATRPEDAERFWLGMAELLRGRRRGWLPLAGFEFLWHAGALSLRVWVPGPVAVRAVREVAESAWPGSVTRVVPGGTGDTSDATALAMARLGVTAAAAAWRCPGAGLAAPAHRPQGRPAARPVQSRGLPGRGEAVLVQVLARPARPGASRVPATARPGRPGSAGGAALGGTLRLVSAVLGGLSS